MAATIRFSVPIVRNIINHKQFLKGKKTLLATLFFVFRFSGRLAPSGSVSPECQKAENEFCDAILTSDNEYIRSYLTGLLTHPVPHSRRSQEIKY